MAKPFNPDEYLAAKPAKGFDPDAYLAATAKAPKSEGKTGEAALAGFGQAATFGYLPQLQTIAEPALARAYNLLPGQDVEAPSWKQSVPGSPEYIAARDQKIKEQQSLEKASPTAFNVGQAGGLLTSAFVPGLGIGTKAAKGLIPAALQGAKAGAITGAIQNPGDVEGQAGPQIDERIRGALTGGAFGGVVGAATGLVGKGIDAAKKLPQKLGEFSDEMAFRQLGPTKRDVKMMMKGEPKGQAYKSIRELGQFVRERGLVKGGENIDDVANRVSAYQKNIGEQIGSTYDRVSEKLGAINPKALSGGIKKQISETALRPKEIAKEIIEDVTGSYTGKSGGRDAIRAVTRELENLNDLGNEPASIKAIFEYRKGLDRKIYDKATDNVTKDALKDVRRLVADKINKRIEAADGLLGSADSKLLKSLNKEYGLVSKAADMSQDQLASQMKNQFFSLTDKILGAGAMTASLTQGDVSGEGLAKTIGGGLLAAGASRVGRRYGPAVAMKGSQALSDAANKLATYLSASGNALTPQVVKELYDGIGKKYGRSFADMVFKNPALSGALTVRATGKPGFIEKEK